MWNLKAIKWLSISHCKFHTLKHYFRFLCMPVLDMKMNLLFSQFDILTFFFTETLFLTALISIPRADFASSLPFILLYPLLLLPPCAVGESPQQDWLYLQASCMTLMLTAGAVTKFSCCVSEFYPFFCCLCMITAIPAKLNVYLYSDWLLKLQQTPFSIFSFSKLSSSMNKLCELSMFKLCLLLNALCRNRAATRQFTWGHCVPGLCQTPSMNVLPLVGRKLESAWASSLTCIATRTDSHLLFRGLFSCVLRHNHLPSLTAAPSGHQPT